MNQISRFRVCRSLLRKYQFTRCSSKPISYFPLISNNPTSSNLITVLVSKFHHTLNNPPQIFSTPGNHFRKFSEDPVPEAASECEFDDDYVNKEIFKVFEAGMDAQTNIELGSLPPLDAVKILADKFNALIEKLGIDIENDGDFPPHLQRFREKIELLEESVDETVAFGEHVAAGKNGGLRPVWCEFKRWYRAGGDCEGETSESEDESDTTLPTAEDQIAMHVDDASSAVVAGNKADIAAAKFNSDDDYLQKEISEVYDAILRAQDNIELGTVPPLDAVKIPIDKFKAIMEIVGLDYEDVGDHPDHQHYMRVRIRTLQDTIHETVAFAKYVAAGKNTGPPCWAEFVDYDAVGEFNFWEESSESKSINDASPTAQDQIVMRVGDASAAVAENLTDNTYQELYVEQLTTLQPNL